MDIDLGHRITQGFNPSTKASNYHGQNSISEGSPVTSAIDISVRCLSDAEIRQLLNTLTDHDIVGWLRRKGVDGWNGANHIHAIWVGSTLKPQLDFQSKAWLSGRSGLASNRRYQFWQPSDVQRAKIKARVPN